jgi:hypothetical protein
MFSWIQASVRPDACCRASPAAAAFGASRRGRRAWRAGGRAARGQAPLDREEEAAPTAHGEDAVDGLRHVVGQGALDPLEVGREPGQEVADRERA